MGQLIGKVKSKSPKFLSKLGEIMTIQRPRPRKILVHVSAPAVMHRPILYVKRVECAIIVHCSSIVTVLRSSILGPSFQQS